MTGTASPAALDAAEADPVPDDLRLAVRWQIWTAAALADEFGGTEMHPSFLVYVDAPRYPDIPTTRVKVTTLAAMQRLYALNRPRLIELLVGADESHAEMIAAIADCDPASLTQRPSSEYLH